MKAFFTRLNMWLTAHPVARKPLNTLWQSFAVVFAAGLSNVTNAFAHGGLKAAQAALLALILAAGAAALSALKTATVEMLKSRR